ncbi:MAG TPA: type II toxin-antitoxin system RelE/ParE family toxin [Brachybacterium sp.]|nr:type II toxin-antitoxin system RelE/ParE family toxin [Brachybacterium sp.]
MHHARSLSQECGYDETERLWRRERRWSIDPRTRRVALRTLRQVGSAESLEDLRVPPGNRLEALKGDRAGQHSIRIDDQWRVCFVWTDAGPEEVQIADYH